MKKKKNSTIIVLLLIVAVVIGIKVTRSYKELNSPFLLENIEALSDGEDGTPVGDCYERSYSLDDVVQKFAPLCDTRTTNSMIYPCAHQDTYDFYKRIPNKCTK